MHSDSHGDNFTYDEEKKQLYWLDNAGLRFESGPSGLSKLYAFKETLNSHILEDTALKDLFKIAATYFSPSKISELNLSGQDKDNAEELKHDRPEPYALQVALKFFPKNKLQEIISRFQSIINSTQKRLLAIKSFGEGYCMRNPQGKIAYNQLIQEEKWPIYINILQMIEDALNLPETSFAIKNPKIS